MGPTFFLDTETTGLSPVHDRIVEIAIVDDMGDVVLNTLVNPKRPIGYAEQIHGISDQMVVDAPTLGQLLSTIRGTVMGRHVVIYNSAFDTQFFPDKLVYAGRIDCAMRRYAAFRGSKWTKLAVAADQIGYRWEGNPHRALADALACRAIWQWLDKKGDSLLPNKPAGPKRKHPDLSSPMERALVYAADHERDYKGGWIPGRAFSTTQGPLERLVRRGFLEQAEGLIIPSMWRSKSSYRITDKGRGMVND